MPDSVFRDIPIYRAGTRTTFATLPVVVDEDGEEYVTVATALHWEIMHLRAAMTEVASSRLPRRRKLWYKGGAVRGSDPTVVVHRGSSATDDSPELTTTVYA